MQVRRTVPFLLLQPSCLCLLCHGDGCNSGFEMADLGTEEIIESDNASINSSLLRVSEEMRGGQRRERSPTPVVEHARESGEDVAASDEEEQRELALKKRKWSGTESINRRWFAALSRATPVDNLSFDVNLEHGQTRPLKESHVTELVASLLMRPPMHRLKVTAWENTRDRRLYVLAGQHLTKAVRKIKADRESQGLALEAWMREMDVDVLKFETPLDERRTVAGALNASTRLHRTTSISECLQLLKVMDADPVGDVSDKIVRAVEQSGLNPIGSTPVCFVQGFQCIR